jgi:peptide subunit release factor 1 (eRF1)
MTQHELQTLFARQERPDTSMLSVYLNVDQARQANLNRKFETQLRDMMSSIRKTIKDPGELERFQTASRHIEDFVMSYKNGHRGIAMFFDSWDGFFWHQHFDVPFENHARWDHEFFLQPMAAAIDEFDRFGVLLVDHANWRVFSVFLGAVQEHVSRGFDPKKVRHIKTVGTDHLGSASHVQRKADEQIRLNLRRAIQAVDSLVQTQQIQSLIIAGTSEVVTELREMLPKRLALRVIGTVDIAIDASADDLLPAVTAVAERHERETERQTVNEVLTAAAKKQKAVTGLTRTLNAVNQSRVWQLIYSDGLSEPGFECRQCAALFSADRPSCLYCGGPIERLHDVIGRAVEHAVRQGARIERVSGDASSALKVSGGIAAFLKARPAHHLA